MWSNGGQELDNSWWLLASGQLDEVCPSLRPLAERAISPSNLTAALGVVGSSGLYLSQSFE